MRRRPALAFALALCAAQAAASPADEARMAAAALRDSIGALQSAERARDRVAALTATIGAYEEGLAVLRDSLRRAAIREREIASELQAERDRVSRILGAMTAMRKAPDELLLLHPGGPEATVRSGLVLSSVAPALQAEADALRVRLEEVAALRALREDAAATLQAGLVAAQSARTALSQAVQDRTDLPRRFLEDPEELRALVASADTLDSFAAGVAAMETDIGPPMEDFAGAKGALPLPARGRLLRAAGEADAAGIRRPGMVVATEPGALVTAPWPATIRYRGPLLDYRNVMILEPAEDYLLVLAGLGIVYGEIGDVLPAGAPLGLMPDGEGEGAPADTGRTETLYIELRYAAEPVDPGGWFSETKGTE